MNSILTNIYIFARNMLPIILQKPTRICIFFIFCIYCFSFQSNATIIVLCGNRDSIVVATDSRAQIVGLPGDSIFSTCKIHKINDSLFMALTGNVGNATKGIIIPDTLRNMINVSSGDFNTKINQATERLSKCLVNLLNRIPIDSTDGFLSVIFFGRENMILNYWVKNFTRFPDSINNQPIIRITSDQDSLIRQQVSHVVSAKDVEKFAQPYISSHRNDFFILQQVKDLMDTALQYSAGHSSIPIDIICLTKTGYNWIQRKQICRE